MRLWIELAKSGIEFYECIALLLLPGMAIMSFGRDKKINIVRICIDQLFVLYTCCMAAIVFLPTMDSMSLVRYTGYQIQLVPFHWVADMIQTPGAGVISGVLLNVLLTVPFGAYLRAVCKWNTKKVVAASLLLSVCIELIQLGGLFGSFPASYRVTDVDDLIANTLGGFVGCILVDKLNLLWYSSCNQKAKASV